MAQLKICGLMRPEDVLLCCACGVGPHRFCRLLSETGPLESRIYRGTKPVIVLFGQKPQRRCYRRHTGTNSPPCRNAASRLRAAPLPGNARGDASPCGGTPRNGNRLYQSHSRSVRRHAGYARLCDSCMHGLTLRAIGRRPYFFWTRAVLPPPASAGAILDAALYRRVAQSAGIPRRFGGRTDGS